MSEQANVGRLILDVAADAQGLRRQLQAQVKAAAADVRVQIRTDLDSRGLKTQVKAAAQEAQTAARVKVGMDLNDRGLKTKMAAVIAGLKASAGDVKVKVQTEADTAAAEAQIAAVAKDRRSKVKVDADTSPATRAARRAKDDIEKDSPNLRLRIDKGAASELMSIGRTTTFVAYGFSLIVAAGSAIVQLVGGLGQVAAGLFAMASAASAAAGAVALIPAALSAGVQVVGTLIAGFSGIGAAIKAAGQQNKTAARSDAGAAQQRVSALRAIQDAQERVATTQVQNARAVQDAEERVAAAQQDTRNAQLELNAAREEAARRLQDLRLQLKGAALDEEDAQLGVERALQRLQQAKDDPRTSDLDLHEADLNYREAQQRLAEVRQSNKNLREDANKALRAGIAGSTEVLAANAKIADAQNTQRKAEIDLARTRQDAARASADAAKQLARAQQDAAVRTNTATAANNALAQSMAALSPAGRKFVNFYLHQVQPVLTSIKNAAQEALLPGAQAAIGQLLTLAAPIRTIVSETGRTIGKLMEDTASLLTTPAWRRDLLTIGANNTKAIDGMGHALIRLLDPLRDIVVVVGTGPNSLAGRLTRFTDSLAENIAVSIHARRENGQLARFFQHTGDVLAQWGRIIRNIATGIFNIGKAASPAGQALTDSFEGATEDFVKWTRDDAAGIRKFFDGTVEITKTFGRILVDIAGLLGRVMNNPNNLKFMQAIETQLGPALGRLIRSLENSDTGGILLQGLADLFDAITSLVQSGSLGQLVGALASMAGFLKVITANPIGNAVVGGLITLAGIAGPLAFVAGSLGKIVGAAGKLSKIPGLGGALERVVGTAGTPMGPLTKAGAGGPLVGARGLRGSRIAGTLGKAGRAGLAGAAVGLVGGIAGGIIDDGRGGARSAVGGAVSGAAAGAGIGGTIGSIVPGLGTGIGAAVGAVVGAIWGAVAKTIGWKSIGRFIISNFDRATTWVTSQAARWGAAIAAPFQAAFAYLNTLPGFRAFRQQMSILITDIQHAWTVFWQAVEVGWSAFWTAVGQITARGSRYLGPVISAAFTVLSAIFNVAIRGWRIAWNLWWGVFGTVARTALHLLGPVLNFGFTVAAQLIRNFIATASNVWSAISFIWRVASSVMSTTRTIIGTALDRIHTAFSTAVTNIRTAWDGLRAAASAPVKFVVDTVYNNGIRSVWNKVAGLINAPELPLLKYATGGVVPGYRPGHDSVHAMLSPGEGILVPEAVRALAGMMGTTATKAVNTFNGMFTRRNTGPKVSEGQQTFAGGGVVSDVRNWLTNTATSGVKKLRAVGTAASEGVATIAGKAGQWVIGGLEAAANRALSPVRNAITSALGGNQFSRAVGSVATRAIDSITGRLKKEDASAASLAGGAFSRSNGGKWPARVLGQVSANTLAAEAFVRAFFGIGNIGDLGSRPNVSDHPWGKAMDVMIANWQRPEGQSMGNRVASWFVNNAGKFGTKYVIWNARIDTGSGWRPYSHPNGWTDPTSLHKDHVHVSFLGDGATVKPRTGGTLAVLAEKGRSETVVDTGLVNQRLADMAQLRDLLKGSGLGQSLIGHLELSVGNGGTVSEALADVSWWLRKNDFGGVYAHDS